MNLFDAIFSESRSTRTAILYEHQSISYSALREQTLLAAQALVALGVKRGDRVALLLNDSPEFIACFVAICCSGAIAVPINMALRLEEQLKILNDCTASTAIVEPEIHKALLGSQRLAALNTIVVVSRQRGSDGSTVNDAEEFEGEVNGLRFKDFERLVNEQRIGETDLGFPQPAENQPAFILYTSGSTGEPKGAVHRQADILYTNETYCREVMRLRDGDRLFSSSRLPFAYGLGNSFTFPLLNGRTAVLCRDKPTPEVIARVFAKDRPTIFFAVPVVYRLLLDSQNRSESAIDPSSLRLCISAGEALPAAIGEEWEQTFGVPVLDGIGSTEMLHMWMSNHEDDVVYGSSGKLLQGYEARLLDPEGQPSAPGTEGNLWVRGASAAIEYWQKSETSSRTFVDGWVRTGDLYRQDERGYWFHMGRSDDCFKSSGQWVSPVEVEGVLVRHEALSSCAVVEDFDANGLPGACAFVVLTNTMKDDGDVEESLRELARANLPRYKQPRRYVFVKELPYTATGKIQRFKLRERLKTVPRPRYNVQSLTFEPGDY